MQTMPSTGLSIYAKKVWGQFLIMSQPRILIDGVDVGNLMWNQEVFLPLNPHQQAHIEVHFPYLFGPACRAQMVVLLQPGEVQRYRYNTAVFVMSPGKFTRTG